MPFKTEVNGKTLQEVFESFNNLKVLIVGDVMIDSYLWGKVERISPEAPVPVLHVHKRDKRLGGAANVALNVQALGATPVLCSVIGDDPEGITFNSLLEKSLLTSQCVIKSPHRITTIKHRVMSGSHHMLRVDEEMDNDLEENDFNNLLEVISKQVPLCDVIIFEDYDKGVLNKAFINKVISLAKSYNIPTVVDPKKKNFLHYTNASLFKPNKKELKEGLKIDSNLNDPEDLSKAVEQLKNTLNADCIMITLSEKGVYIQSENEKIHIPAHIREISDVSGAGDTVISIAALCYALKLPAKFIAELSNLGGGLVCEHIGVVPVSKNALFLEAERLDLQLN